MKTIIHVNQHAIKANRRRTGINAGPEPVITVKAGADNTYGHQAVIRTRGGEEVARVVYKPQAPLSCGAEVWIETDLVVDIY